MSRKSKEPLAPERWAKVSELFEHCAALPAASREKELDKLAAGDRALRDEVASLLTALETGPVDLEKPLLGEILESSLPTEMPVVDLSPMVPGSTLGKFELLRKIGTGGMAEVFLARAQGPAGFKKEVALKRVHPHLASDPDFRKLFEYEAKLSARLSHPNIVQVYDFFDDNSGYVLVMEYVNGENLSRLLKKARLIGKGIPPGIALYIGIEMARGLAHAHGQGIVHRDVSPKNALVTPEGAIRLLDFGIAKARDRTRVTRSGELRGTLDYLAPERVNGKEADSRSDVFSLCVLVTEMLSGQSMFGAESIAQTLLKIEACEEPFRRVTALAVAEPVKEVLLRGLQKDPSHRFPSARELAKALERSAASSYPGVSAVTLMRYLSTLTNKGSAGAPHFAEAPVSGGAETTRARLTALAPAVFGLVLVGLGYYLGGKSAPSPAPERNPLSAARPAPETASDGPVRLEPGTCLTKIESHPTGASIQLNDVQVGVAPMSVPLKCGIEIRMSLYLRGYLPYVETIIVTEPRSQLELSLSKEGKW